MWKAAIAGAIALAVTGAFFSRAHSADASAGRYSLQARTDVEVDGKIARAKAALRLTPEQERHWPRVETALREIAAEKDRVETASAGGGFVSRMGARASGLVLSASAIKRLVSAARPLLASLDDNQKHDARQMARAMGLGNIAERFE